MVGLLGVGGAGVAQAVGTCTTDPYTHATVSCLVPTITLSATSTTAGTIETITGTNFSASESITVTVMSTPQTLGTTTSSASGNFTATETLPSNLAVGQHVITAAGKSGDSATAALTIVSASSGFSGTGASATSTGNGGSLASTGADILMGLLAATLLILLGTSLTLAARRRRQTV